MEKLAIWLQFVISVQCTIYRSGLRNSFAQILENGKLVKENSSHANSCPAERQKKRQAVAQQSVKKIVRTRTLTNIYCFVIAILIIACYHDRI